jgi:DNA-binding NarL/FixJ family response regulator
MRRDELSVRAEPHPCRSQPSREDLQYLRAERAREKREAAEFKPQYEQVQAQAGQAQAPQSQARIVVPRGNTFQAVAQRGATVRRLWARGLKQREIADLTGLCPATIAAITRGLPRPKKKAPRRGR